jgi:hypothetical protein
MVMKKHHPKKRSHRRRETPSAPREPQVYYDSHLSCANCGQHLYVPEDQLPVIRQGITRQGIAGLLCTCRAITLIDTSYFSIKRCRTQD